MIIDLIRSEFTDKSTVGRLQTEGHFLGWSLEDCCREPEPGLWKPELKIPGKTAIPYGLYEVTITFSKRFNRALPLLLNVPDFDGVRIHAGNTDADTHGCILVGKTKSRDFIGDSTIAFSLLHLEIEREIRNGKVMLSIQKGAA